MTDDRRRPIRDSRAMTTRFCAPILDAPADPTVFVGPLILGEIDHDWKFSEVSADAIELLGWDREAYRGLPLQSTVHPDDAPALLEALARSSADRRGTVTTLRVRGCDGGWMRLRCAVSPLCDHDRPRFAVAAWSSPTEVLRDAAAAEETGAALAAAGDEAGAVAAFDQALAAYQEAGADRDARRVLSRLRRLGVRRCHWRTEPRPVYGWASLTDTERRVAEHVAEGLTNRQVAEQMFLSPHTIDFHLRQIYRKLDITSRVELARLVLTHEDEEPLLEESAYAIAGCGSSGRRASVETWSSTRG
jgi:PAS domain S-box-containing protein